MSYMCVWSIYHLGGCKNRVGSRVRKCTVLIPFGNLAVYCCAHVDQMAHSFREHLPYTPSQCVIELDVSVHLITNLKEGGMVHRLHTASHDTSWERRRSRCGWRAGSAASHVKFWSTKRWPPCPRSRLCAKCFPCGIAERGEEGSSTVEGDDQIEDI